MQLRDFPEPYLYYASLSSSELSSQIACICARASSSSRPSSSISFLSSSVMIWFIRSSNLMLGMFLFHLSDRRRVGSHCCRLDSSPDRKTTCRCPRKTEEGDMFRGHSYITSLVGSLFVAMTRCAVDHWLWIGALLPHREDRPARYSYRTVPSVWLVQGAEPAV